VVICCTDGNTHNPGDSPIIGHVTPAEVDLEPKENGEFRSCRPRYAYVLDLTGV